MAQIWREEPDELCEGMSVKKLQKVVFAGFEEKKGE
jgi:CRISPR type III-associated protein (TIGR04423 family)